MKILQIFTCDQKESIAHKMAEIEKDEAWYEGIT